MRTVRAATSQREMMDGRAFRREQNISGYSCADDTTHFKVIIPAGVEVLYHT